MWVQGDTAAAAAAESDEESDLSSSSSGDIQYEILEKQRDEANQRLSELEEVSNQLLKEINVLELQFQIERSCRESAEAVAVKVTKENKALKRLSQMPVIPEDLATVTFDPDLDPTLDCDVVDVGEDSGDTEEETLLLESQAKIAELQASLDGLLNEKMQLEEEKDDLNKQLDQLREQLTLEVEEKEALLRKLNKQTKTINKIKRVSQLVTEEFAEMSEKLELEEGLRQHAEDFAHQMMEQQMVENTHSVMKSSDTGLQLQQVLEQISAVLSDMQRYHQDQLKQSQSSAEGSSVLSELQSLKRQVEASEKERKALETQLSEANGAVTQLQEEVKQLQETRNREQRPGQVVEKCPPPPPPPPPPAPPLPPPAPVTKRKDGARKSVSTKPPPAVDLRAKAVDEMMERIKKGIILKPTKKVEEEDDSSWRDQRSENRKSAILELKGMLDNMKSQPHRRALSRRGIGRKVGETELLLVLQRRRRAMGENQDTSSTSQNQDLQPGALRIPAAGDAPWADESSGAPVLRRLKQNREKRDSRIRASALIISQEN